MALSLKRSKLSACNKLMQPQHIDTSNVGKALVNKNLRIGDADEDTLSVTPDWLKSEDQFLDLKNGQDESHYYQSARPPSPNSPRWAFNTHDDQTPSSLPTTTVLGSSPNWIRDNTAANARNDNYNVFNDQDEEALMQKFKELKRVQEFQVEPKPIEENDDDAELDATPQLYSTEVDDFITISETHLFRQCLHPNPEKRKIGINNVVDVIKAHLTAHKEIVSAKRSSSPVPVFDNLHPKRFFKTYKHIIARFAFDCPLEDIAARFQEVVQLLWDNGISTQKPQYGYLNSPSWFFAPHNLDKIDSKHPLVKSLFTEFFLENGIVAHHSRVILTYPQFGEVFFTTYHYVMRSNGPLPVAWRSYIAMLAASRHNCSYLVRRQEAEFIGYGGDPSWLKGIGFAPSKLQALVKYNEVLAHQPWKLTEQHVEELVRGSDPWSIAELVHAVVIMCHFHSMCGFVFGCGLLDDDDVTPIEDIVNDINKYKKQTSSRRTVLEGENLKVVETLNKIMGGDEGDDDHHHQPEKKDTPVLPVGVHNNLNNYDCFQPRFASMTYWSTISEESHDAPKLESPRRPVTLDRYVVDKQMAYTDFDVRSKDYEQFNPQEYNWKDHAFTMLNRFYNGSADLLDREFEVIYNLTENKFSNHENIDTSAFRSAIWFYVHRLYGMLHDDFNYTNINRLLNINLKKYVKTVSCYPERTKREQWIDMGFELRSREKIHVNLICTEARKQMELCYGLQVINAYMTRQT